MRFLVVFLENKLVFETLTQLSVMSPMFLYFYLFYNVKYLGKKKPSTNPSGIKKMFPFLFFFYVNNVVNIQIK